MYIRYCSEKGYIVIKEAVEEKTIINKKTLFGISH